MKAKLSLGLALIVLIPITKPRPTKAAEPVEIKRRVLALYKSSEGDSPTKNGVFALLEQPLESMGLVVDYADADLGPPSDDKMAAYRGVITFFHGPVMTDARGYLAWLNRQAEDGRKVVVFGEIGALADRASKKNLTYAQVSEALSALGFRYDGFPTTDRARISLVRASPAMSFEEPYTQASAQSYERIVPLSSDVTSYLTLTRTDLPDGKSDPVLATPSGGYASRDQLLYEYQQGDVQKQRWHLNPYLFLSEALGVSKEPHFDAATLNGRRLWMAHIDGDGFLSPSESGLLCGQVMLERVLRAYALPVSVSIISGELDKDGRAPQLAREIFSLPNIEPASHSATHPMDWSAPGLDLAAEIDGSINTLNEKVMPEGKRVALFTWSSLANPPAEALKRLADLGVANMNGLNGDTGFTNRFDKFYPSRTHLSPMTRRVGEYTQLSHRASNDFDMTGGWDAARRGGYASIVETFDRTAEQPEIPAHVYFHFYSAATLKSLSALASVFDWAAKHEVAPVFVSEYANLVEDFRSASLARDDEGRTLVRNFGACRTVVFPDASKQVDFSRSRDVVGWAVRHGQLYVFLDGNDSHLIALSTSTAVFTSVAAAAGWVDRFAVDGDNIELVTRSVGETEVSLRVGRPGSYHITAAAADDAAGKRAYSAVASSKDHLLTFRFPATGHDKLEVAPASLAQAAGGRAGAPLFAFALLAFPIVALVRARRRLA